MKLIISFFICLVLTVSDTEVLKRYSYDNKRISKIECGSNGKDKGVIVTHIQRVDELSYEVNEKIDICSVDFTNQNEIKRIVVKSTQVDTTVKTDFSTHLIDFGAHEVIEFYKVNNVYRVLRILTNLLLLIISFIYFKSYLKYLLPLLVANTIWLLVGPGSINFDILDYISAYQSYPDIDDEFAIARLLLFFIPFSITKSVLYYKVTHILIGVYCLYFLLRKIFKEEIYIYLGVGLIMFSPIYMNVYTSCTDMSFTSLLFLKIALMIQAFRKRDCYKTLGWLVCITMICYFYRYNSLALAPVDIIFFGVLIKGRNILRKLSLIIGIVTVLSTFFISFGANENTGYIAFPALYELTDIYIDNEASREELEWINNYVDTKRVEDEVVERTSLIKAFYSNSTYERDRIYRDNIKRDYFEILKSYLFYTANNFTLVVKTKIKYFAYTIGFSVNDIEKHYYYQPLINWVHEGGDFSYLSSYDLNSFPQLVSFKNQLDKSPIGWIVKTEQVIWIWVLIYCILFVVLTKRKRDKRQAFFMLYPLFYLASFAIFNHGFLLTYTYFMVVMTKVLVLYSISISKNTLFLKRN